MRGLGTLEAKVMEVLWSADETSLSVRQVREGLGGTPPLAYITVMTVLDKLHTKGWTRRERQGRAWVYRAAWTRAEAGARVLREVLDTSDDAHRVLTHFARSVSAEESALLRKILADDGD
jgi:predicted transcriptional regulator